MGYFAVYCPADDAGEITGGDHVASNAGYDEFLRWAETLSGFPALAALAEEGAADPAALEADLSRALQPDDQADEPSAFVKGVAARLLATVRERPEGTAAVAVTDGTAGDDEEEEGDARLAHAVKRLTERGRQQDKALDDAAIRLIDLTERLGLD
jgi:hypothetical protein